MHTHSLWTGSEPHLNHPQLMEPLTTDVAVVGGGITGLTIALLLQKQGRQVAVFENHLITTGETFQSSGHLTEILDDRYMDLISKFGRSNSELIARSQRVAIAEIESLIREYSIECDFHRVPGYLFAETEDGKLNQELVALRSINVSAVPLDHAPLPFATSAAIRVGYQAQFHPGKYLLGLAQAFTQLGGDLFENTRIVEVTDGNPCRLKTETTTIQASSVVIAAHVPVTNPISINTKIAAYRTYALAAQLREPLSPGLFWDLSDPYHYLRTFTDSDDRHYLIVGGEDHKTGTESQTETHFRRLENYVRSRFNIGTIPHCWSGQIIEPVDGLPYIGRNPRAQNVFVSTGYSGNGLTFGTLGALIISDLVQGRENAWAGLYHADRVHATASFASWLTENIDLPTYFIGDRISDGDYRNLESIQKNQGGLIKVDGKKYAIYRDHTGELHAFSPVCPHLGCHVHWNGAEASWDCPCHGSRFSSAGKVCNGPALQDLKPIPIESILKPTKIRKNQAKKENLDRYPPF